MNILRNAWTTYGGRAIGVAAGWIVGKLIVAPLAAKGISVTPEVQQAAETIISHSVDAAAGMVGTYVLAHRGASKFINPGDAASGHIAAEEKDWKRELIAEARAASAAADAAVVADEAKLGGE